MAKPLPLIVDNFAGGGGASTGIEAALGRAVDIAINHDEEAIRMHEVNHPGTHHIRNNIWQVDPRDVVKGQPVQLAWFSPDCKHFSKAKGGKPREKSIRDLAWVVVLWAQRVAPDVILLENVEEFRTWGPLDEEGKPIKERTGETFAKWCKSLRRAGYKLQFRELRACDYGAPTIRKRFFMIARRDGLPIAWPEPTHGKPGSPEVLSGKRLPWRTAAEIIDWSIPCPSIFERKKPLAEKTLRRIAHGIMKFVVNNPAPFIVPLTHHQAGARGAGIDQPMATVTGANRGEHAIVTPVLVGTAFKNTRAARAFDLQEPVRTMTAQPEYGLVSPVLTPFYGDKDGRPRAANGVDEPLRTSTVENRFGVVEAALAPFASYAQQGGNSRSVEDPLHTVTASDGDHNTVLAAHLVHCGNGEREGQAPRAIDVQRPLNTVMAQRNNHGAVTALLQKFAQNGQGCDPAEPLHTVMAGAPRHAVVCAHLEQANGGPNNDRLAGRAADQPLSTATASGSQQRIVTSNLVKLRGGEDSHFESCGVGMDEPLHTICASGTHMAEVRAFLLKYYGTDQDPQLGEPLHTVTTKDRYGVVTVTIGGEEYAIVDIGMRMLTPRELFAAQGFPGDYIIDHDAEGRPITKTAQVAKCGNSVCPPIAEALVRAQFPAEAAAVEPEQVAA